MDVTSAFQGITASLRDLYNAVAEHGWNIKKVKYDKKTGYFLAEASSPHGETISKTGRDEKTAVTNLLIAVTRTQHMRSSVRTATWAYTFVDQLKPIAEAYAKAAVYDPKAAIAFKELGDDALHRAEVLGKHLEIKLVHNPEPYLDAEKMAEDVYKRRKLEVSRAGTEHPVWSNEQMVAFRICFDVLGYAVAGAEWDWRGDNKAFAAYAPLVSANAQQALFTEVLGQSAYANRYRAYGPQKIALLPQFLEAAQDAEGVHPKAPGTHPSQSFPPVEAPKYKPFKRDENEPYPITNPPIGLPQFEGAVDPHLSDPNLDWRSGFDPLEPNAYLDYGDPLEYEKSLNNAKLLNTEWSMFKDGAGQPDYERMKLAVVNSLRAAILSPNKLLAHNAVHYQHVMHMPAGVSDPAVFWDTLDKQRMDWNEARGFPRFSHRVYWQYVKPVANILLKLDPTKSPEEAQKQVEDLIFDWIVDEQNTIMAEEGDKAETKRNTSDEVERKAFKRLADRMKQYVDAYSAKTDISDGSVQPFLSALSAPEDPLEGITEGWTRNPLKGKYAGFMGSSCRYMAQIGKHSDELLKAALADVHEHDGQGHHWRATCLQLGLPGVNPKVASFAWLLLQPLTAEIAVIDRHIMRLLGYNPEDKTNQRPREYFKMERELAAGRDAAGYEHMPLGVFQWSLWDANRTGAGSHQDHSAFKVDDPTPYERIDWIEPASPEKGTSKPKTLPEPEWWKLTQPVRDQVKEEWEERQGKDFRQDHVPYTRVSKTAQLNARIPWFTHPQNFQRIEGQPGETIMAHATQTLGLSTPEIWQLLTEAGKYEPQRL